MGHVPILRGPIRVAALKDGRVQIVKTVNSLNINQVSRVLLLYNLTPWIFLVRYLNATHFSVYKA